LINVVGLSSKNIILMGRSIGSGPAVEMASLFDVSALVLISPFTSLKGFVSDKLGDQFTFLIRESFNNL
jgi:hypothetical protein